MIKKKKVLFERKRIPSVWHEYVWKGICNIAAQTYREEQVNVSFVIKSN